MPVHRTSLALAVLVVGASSLAAQAKGKPEDTEVWSPVPRVVTPGRTNDAPPSDAIVLFNGGNLDQWVSVKDPGPAGWTVSAGGLTGKKGRANSRARGSLQDYQ